MGRLRIMGRLGAGETAHPLGEPLDAAHGVGLRHGSTDVDREVEREADEADLRAGWVYTVAGCVHTVAGWVHTVAGWVRFGFGFGFGFG